MVVVSSYPLPVENSREMERKCQQEVDRLIIYGESKKQKDRRGDRWRKRISSTDHLSMVSGKTAVVGLRRNERHREPKMRGKENDRGQMGFSK